jgi:hypothetical protein
LSTEDQPPPASAMVSCTAWLPTSRPRCRCSSSTRSNAVRQGWNRTSISLARLGSSYPSTRHPPTPRAATDDPAGPAAGNARVRQDSASHPRLLAPPRAAPGRDRRRLVGWSWTGGSRTRRSRPSGHRWAQRHDRRTQRARIGDAAPTARPGQRPLRPRHRTPQPRPDPQSCSGW